MFLVDETTWAGVINPDLKKLSDAGKYTRRQPYFDEEMIRPLKWVDGTPVNDNQRSKYRYHGGIYCQMFDNLDDYWHDMPDGHFIRNWRCNNIMQVICQYDCDNINKREYNHMGCYWDKSGFGNYYLPIQDNSPKR